MKSDARILRADLHLHSYHSGYAGHLRFLRARDCYSEPEAIYRTAKARGMDLVTITDHDSIDGCLEFLDRHPDGGDFFVSEEIECRFPDAGLKVHIGAYGIDERIHREIQPLRRNVFEAVAYLRTQGVFYVLNHPFFFFKGQMPLERYLATVRELFPAFEVRNGTMLEATNLLVETVLAGWANESGAQPVAVGGSDSHTVRGVGTTYTEAPATDPRSFLESLRAGRGRAGGRHGGALREASEIYGVVARYWASLAGFGRRDLSGPRRALGLAFSALTFPGEFTPLLVAALDKRGERARTKAYAREWQAACVETVEANAARRGDASTASSGSSRSLSASAGASEALR